MKDSIMKTVSNLIELVSAPEAPKDTPPTREQVKLYVLNERPTHDVRFLDDKIKIINKETFTITTLTEDQIEQLNLQVTTWLSIKYNVEVDLFFKGEKAKTK